MKRYGAVLACLLLPVAAAFGQQPGPNVNVLPALPANNARTIPQPPGTPPLIPPAFNLTDFLRGDGYQQRQVEPSIAGSSYNPDHIVAVYGDYRTVQFPETTTGTVTSTGWMGISRSYDRGQTWYGGLIPGFPGDTSAIGQSSQLYGLNAGSDATIATTPGGHFYIGGLFWTTGGISNVAVVHYRDVPDTEGGDTIRYQGAAIVDKGSMSESGNFTDKPGIAADIARGTTSPTVCGPVYIAYTIFTGGTTSTPFVSKLGFSRSKQGRCGTSWDTPQYLNKSYKQNQGAAVAVDPTTGKVYVIWRHIFQAGGDGYPNSILMAVSSDGGATFSSPVPITPAGWSPYDQIPISTSNTGDPGDDLTFRSNAFPTIAIDGNGNVYVASQETVLGTAGYYEPRIVVRTMKAGSNAFTPVGSFVNLGQNAAQQVMPQLTFGAGILKALWYDFRDQNESSTNVSTGTWAISGVDRQVKTYVAQVDVTKSSNFDANGNPIFGSPVVVSQYLLNPYTGRVATVPGTKDLPAVNRPNLPMYVNGSTPFEGDYIALQTVSPFVPNAAGSNPPFRWATQPSDYAANSAYAAWTDNRDVIPPTYGSGTGTPNLFDFSSFGWSYYAPPGTGNSCYNQGSRDANIYFSEVKPGVITGSPALNRQLVSSAGKPIERDFPLYVQNPNATPKYFVLSFASGASTTVQGSFEQGKEMTGQVTTTDVTVLPQSTVTATLFAYCPTCTSSAPFAPFSVSFTETDSNFNPIANPIRSQVTFDNDPSAPLVNNIDTELHDVTVSNAQFSNPQYSTPQYSTPQYSTADFSNPQYSTPQYSTTGLSDGDLTPVGDFIWTVQDVGNTASAYLSLTNVAVQSLGSGYTYQVIISRAYNFPYTTTCNSQSIPVDQIISVISNPQYSTPQYSTPQYSTPQYSTAQYGDATFAAFPPTNAGSDSTIKMPRQTDFVYVVLRVYRSSGGTTPLSALEITNFLNNISQTVYPQAAPVSPTKGTTTLSLASSANPSVQGSAVTFTATVTLINNPANATPGGLVTFYDGATQLGSGSVGSNNKAMFSTSALTPGLHTIVAKYAGDANFLPSTTALGQTVLAVSTITLSSSQNPSVYGQSVTFTATLLADFSHFTPTGTVTFYVDGNNVDSGPVDPTTHQITYSTSTLTVGSHQIYVNYSNDPNFSGCTSTAITQIVNQGGTTTGLLVSPSNPTVGQTLTLIATVLPVSPSSGIPTGKVTFKATQNVGGGMGTTTLGTTQLNNTGNAQISVPTGGSSGLTAGTWTFEGDYNGDGNFTASVGTQQVVLVAALVVTSSNLPSGIVGVGYGPQPLSATGGIPPYCWSNSAGTCPLGSVPIGNNGFQINAAGQITGVPQHMGASQFVAYVSDSGPPVQTASGTITIIVSGPIITAMALPNGSVGSAYPNTPLAVIGGIPPLQWTISSGSLPSGMGLSPSGTISGTPTASGTFNFTAMVTDANGNTGAQGFTVLVSPAFGDLIVADGPQGSPQVVRINPNGLNSNVVATISGGGLADAVAVDPSNGTIYVADPVNKRIVKLTPFGAQSNFFVGSPLQNPVAIAVDSSGNVYAGDNVANAIFKFTSAGASLGQFGTIPGGQPGNPDIKMAFDSSGNLVVASDDAIGTGISEIDLITPGGAEKAVYNSNNNTNTIQAVTSVGGLAIAPSGDYFVEDWSQHLLLDVSNPGTSNMNVTVVDSTVFALGLVLLPSSSNTVFDHVAGTQLSQTSVPGPTTTTLINGSPLTSANDVALYRPQSLPSYTITANASGTAISTLSGAEGVAANLQTGDVFLESHQDPVGNNVQLGVVHSNRMASNIGNSTALTNCDGTGIAINPLNGQIIVADQLASRIALIAPTPSFTVSTLITVPWTINPLQNGTCQQQYAVAQTPSGAVLYFWDNSQAGLYKLAPLTSSGTLSGPIVSLDGSDAAGQHFKTSGNHIAFDPSTGTLLLSDSLSGSVFEVNPATASMTTLFSGLSTGVDLSIALKPDTSQVFVQQGNAIYVGPRSGGGLTLVASGFTQLTNIFLAQAHNVWFTEWSGNRIAKMNLGLPSALYAVDKSTNTVYEIVETGSAPATGFTEFSIPTSFADAIGITAGPDGNLWFAESNGNNIASVTPTGSFSEYGLTSSSSTPRNVTTGPDGNIWFTENAVNKIGVIAPGSSAVTAEYSAAGVTSEGGITAGPDGNLWFTASCGGAGNCIGYITPSAAAFTTYNLSNSTAAAQGIVAGPDGNLWFTEENGNKIGVITPGGSITEYPVPTSNAGPYAITAGPDGNLWFTEANSGKIGRITTTGTVTEFATSSSSTNPQGITVGPDGNIWFSELSGNNIGVVQMGSPNKVTEFSLPSVGSYPWGITAGP